MRLFSDFALGTAVIWGEARGEPTEGRVAVGEVIRNRMKKRGETLAEVILAPIQFSCFWWKDPNFIPLHQLEFTNTVVLACSEAWVQSETSELTGGATLYLNPDLANPPWAAKAIKTVKIGRHQFFREP